MGRDHESGTIGGGADLLGRIGEGGYVDPEVVSHFVLRARNVDPEPHS